MDKIKNAKEKKFNEETEQFSFVYNHKVYNGNLNECDSDIAQYIVQNFKRVNKYELDTKSDLYKYPISNGGEYEMLSVTNIYSRKFFTEEEFTKIAIKSIKKARWKNDDFALAQAIVKENKDFCFLEWGYGVNAFLLSCAEEIANGKDKEKVIKYLDGDEREELEEILVKYY